MHKLKSEKRDAFCESGSLSDNQLIDNKKSPAKSQSVKAEGLNASCSLRALLCAAVPVREIISL
jgi:hypothetical protein